jgi:glycosyltransferase involved in cell wall biosynthesis
MSAHAKDVWTIPDWEKREKLLSAAWTVTCSRLNLDHLRALAPEADIALAYHGLDLARFPAPRRAPGLDGSDPARPVRILAVARAVEKKGLDVLLDALALLPPELHWRFEHVGGGEFVERLKVRAEALGLGARVSWLGPATRDEVIEALRHADLFCLPVRVAHDGDRDGVPNVIMEAMSQELPVVATDAAAIPEIVTDGETGLLVPPEDPAALARALGELMRQPQLRHRLGTAGRRRIVDSFGMDRGLAVLAYRFDLELTREAA